MTAPDSVTEILPIRGVPTPVLFKRSSRARRISLRVDPARGVVLTLPLRASRRAGLTLLKTHEDWVQEKLAALPQALALKPGACVPVSGVPHQIIHLPEGRGGAWIENDTICVAGEALFLPRRVVECLKRVARQRLNAKALDTAQCAGLRPKRIRIKDTRSRWGSCAPDGTLAFCWRLICAPEFVQDYVVAHEVAHLQHMNHSAQFWTLTEQLTPHRRAATAWLISEGPSLLRIG